MFVCSVRGSTLKLFGFIALTLVLVIVTVTVGTGEAVMAAAGENGINYGGIKTNGDRVAFINNFGISVEESPLEEEKFTMPENFDRVIEGYNEIQHRQGLDLSKYKKKKVTRYTYEVDGYEGYDGDVFVNILVYRNKVIGCDVSSADPNGFVKGLIES